jgi:hypothetical protein
MKRSRSGCHRYHRSKYAKQSMHPTSPQKASLCSLDTLVDLKWGTMQNNDSFDYRKQLLGNFRWKNHPLLGGRTNSLHLEKKYYHPRRPRNKGKHYWKICVPISRVT